MCVAPAAAPTAAEAQREQALHEQLEQRADAMLGDVHRRLRQPPREVSVPHKPAHALAHMPMHKQAQTQAQAQAVRHLSLIHI